MVWVLAILAALIVFAIAAAAVGTTTFRLRHEPPPAIFDIDEAVEWIGDRLDEGPAMGLTYPELRALVRFTIDHLRTKGLGALPGEELDGWGDGPPVIVADDDLVAVVIGRADVVDMHFADVHVFAVIEQLLAYLAGIGALGDQVEGPDEPC